jgi:predicted enzyme related to lactoylglutathione lyase
MTPTGLLLPTDDMEATVAFLGGALGLKQKFRDGDRYCAFEFGGLTLGVVAGEEKVVSATALVLRVEDVAAEAARLASAGASVVLAPQEGPHEVRAVLRRPDGGEIVLSARR